MPRPCHQIDRAMTRLLIGVEVLISGKHKHPGLVKDYLKAVPLIEFGNDGNYDSRIH